LAFLIYILENFDYKLSKYPKITEILKYELIIAEPVCAYYGVKTAKEPTTNRVKECLYIPTLFFFCFVLLDKRGRSRGASCPFKLPMYLGVRKRAALTKASHTKGSML
jgi:hypothetical protein